MDNGNAPSLLSLPPRERLADSVAAVLREQILDGEIPAGTQLLQINLSERLGVSRTPLREAFRLLEREGLVRISNGNKTVAVASLAVKDLLDTYLVREVTDGLAARLAAMRDVDEGILAEMRDVNDAMERAVGGHRVDTDAATAAHTRWHLLLLEASGNGQMEEFERLVRLSSHKLIMRQLDEDELEAFRSAMDNLARDGVADHRRILDAIVKRKPDVAEQAAIKHMARSSKHAQNVIARRAKLSR
jgi:GntR family transcriptional regulator of vanillate catabolism